MEDKLTKKYRGFGFVTYKSNESVQLLLANKDLNQIRGKFIDCKIAVPLNPLAS